MFTRRAAATVYTNQRLQRWCFDVELIYLSRRLGVPIKEVQVSSHWPSVCHDVIPHLDNQLTAGWIISHDCVAAPAEVG
jgi:hypothetical protein